MVDKLTKLSSNKEILLYVRSSEHFKDKVHNKYRNPESQVVIYISIVWFLGGVFVSRQKHQQPCCST